MVYSLGRKFVLIKHKSLFNFSTDLGCSEISLLSTRNKSSSFNFSNFSLCVTKTSSVHLHQIFAPTRRSTPSNMTEEPAAKRKCIGVDCPNDAGSLQCPTCLKLGLKESFFCSQDCFKRSWVSFLFCAPNPRNPNRELQLMCVATDYA